MHVHRPVMLLVTTGALLALYTGQAQGAAVRTAAGASAVGWSAVTAATPRPAADPRSTPGTGTHVSVRVLPVPSVTPTTTPTPNPTSSKPATTQPAPGGGGNLPTTGTNGRMLAALIVLGVGAVSTGVLLLWAAAFRRRRESTA